MFALEVEYLLGRVIAARHDDRQSVEWPPHPVRLFSALVAAFHESDLADTEHPLHQICEAGLHWLEQKQQRAPELYANPPEIGVCARDVCMQFVPRNDTNDQTNADGKRHQSMTRDIPLGRARADQRWFPAFTPIDPVVRFIWSEAELPDGLRQGLVALAERVSYLGHSMSPVRVTVTDMPPLATLRPDSSGVIGLRTVGEGRLDHLREIHALRVVNSSIQPRRGLDTFYAVVGASSKPRHQTLYRRWLAFRKVDGPSLPAEFAVGLCERVRRVVLDRFPDPLPEWVSGHTQDGRASLKPHLMVIPLSDVGHRHADGHLLGFTLLAPADVTDEEWAGLEDALYNFDTLLLGAAGKWKVAPVTGAMRTIEGLRASTWQRESRIWGSATPVVFGHFPDRSRKKIIVSRGMEREIRVLEVDEQRRLNLLAEMCEQIGLRVSPAEVRIGPISPLVGVPKAGDFSRSKLAQGRFVTHLWMRFEEPVRGPLVLGRGRFGGLGLMRPLD